MKLDHFKKICAVVSVSLFLGISGCSESKSVEPAEMKEKAAVEKPMLKEVIQETKESSLFSVDALEASIKLLSSDEYEGRGPASKGETLTINYLADELKKAGLTPGAGESYFQEVPLVSISTTPESDLVVKTSDTEMSLQFGADAVLWTKRVSEKESIVNSELVFVGYGVVAPEYDWNDYAGVDMKGKTAVILVNDPGYATQDANLFNGNAMTYYGRRTYKYEEAARQGAAGAIIVHEEGAAGYPWEVVSGSWTGPQFDLIAADKNMSRASIEGWIQKAQAEKIFSAAGFDYLVLKNQAMQKGFKPLSLNATASAAISNKLEQSVSQNVVGILPGSKYPDEYVLYMAHWDHLGKDSELHASTGDGIYNGAVDNASGTAAILEIAKAFASAEKKPERSIVALFVTAEEQGLLGSKHYATNPIYPLDKTAAGFNMDGLNMIGRTSDVSVVGYGNSQLEDYLKVAADKQGRILKPGSSPEKGYFYRSDHFSFAKVGVPVLYAESGSSYIGKEEGYGEALAKDYISNRYHKVADEFEDNWDYSGAIEDMEMLYQIGNTIANERSFPNWYEGNEFRSIRDESRK